MNHTLPTGILAELKKEFKEITVLLSTRIEGNDLEEEIKRQYLYKTSNNDQEQEVNNLLKAMNFLEESEARELIISEEWIKKLHAIIRIDHSQRIHRNEYRTVQNRVGNRNISGFYLPPEYMDVHTLMKDLVAWINSPLK